MSTPAIYTHTHTHIQMIILIFLKSTIFIANNPFHKPCTYTTTPWDPRLRPGLWSCGGRAWTFGGYGHGNIPPPTHTHNQISWWLTTSSVCTTGNHCHGRRPPVLNYDWPLIHITVGSPNNMTYIHTYNLGNLIYTFDINLDKKNTKHKQLKAFKRLRSSCTMMHSEFTL